MEEIKVVIDGERKNARFLSEYKNILSYGSGKYESLGLDYELADLKVPGDDYIVKLKKQIQDRGFSDEF